MRTKVAGCNIIFLFSHLSLDLPNCLPVTPNPLKPYMHFSTPPYMPHGQPITFSFISSTQFCFARCKNHQAPLYVNFSSPFLLPFLYSRTLPKPHTTINTVALQFILIFIAVYCEDKTTAVGTTEIRINKFLSVYRKDQLRWKLYN